MWVAALLESKARLVAGEGQRNFSHRKKSEFLCIQEKSHRSFKRAINCLRQSIYDSVNTNFVKLKLIRAMG